MSSLVDIKKDSASEVYAEYTLSRLPHKIRSSLTEPQIEAIREALVAHQSSSRHQLDVRIRIPLFFRAYYFVILAGRDRRRFILNLELERINRLPRGLMRMFYLSATAGVVAGLFALLFIAAYLGKSFMGIDLFSGHLSDILGIDIYGFAKQLFDAK